MTSAATGEWELSPSLGVFRADEVGYLQRHLIGRLVGVSSCLGNSECEQVNCYLQFVLSHFAP